MCKPGGPNARGATRKMGNAVQLAIHRAPKMWRSCKDYRQSVPVAGNEEWAMPNARWQSWQNADSWAREGGEPSLHRVIVVETEATLNNLSDAPSRRQERVEVWPDRALPAGVDDRARCFYSGIERIWLWRFKSPLHLTQMKLCVR